MVSQMFPSSSLGRNSVPRKTAPLSASANKPTDHATLNGQVASTYAALTTSPQVWHALGVSANSTGVNGQYLQLVLGVDNSYAGGANSNTSIAGLTITPLQVLIILLAAVLMIALDLLVRRTLLGMAMRAISYNRPIVPLMGVSVDRVISLTFAIGSAIAAAGGLMYALAYPVLDPYMGIRIGWWAFIAAVVGGIGNIRGAMLGGFILGTVEVFTPLILPSSTYRDFVAFSLLLLLLVFKPTGLLGRPVFERV